MFRRLRTILVLAVAAGAAAAASQPAAPGHLVFVGTYTGKDSKGIYAFRFDDRTGAFTPLGLAAETPSPSFLALAPSRPTLYAVNETGTYQDKKSGSITAFAVDRAKGTLTALATVPSGGADPCHLECDRTGESLAVANYTGGNFGVVRIAADGKFSGSVQTFGGTGAGPNTARQQGPHGHQVVFDPSNRFLLAADLGIDRVLVYRFDPATGRVTPNEPRDAPLPPGSGPRHLAFHPNGRVVYVINELLSTITTFAWTPSTGTLVSQATVSTLPAGFKGENSTAEIAVHPSGRFLYGSNRGHDSLAVFGIGETGALTLVEHEPTGGRTPRHFTIDPTGRWLIAANQNSGTLAVFAIDPKTGALTPSGGLTKVGSPVCVLFVD